MTRDRLIIADLHGSRATEAVMRRLVRLAGRRSDVAQVVLLAEDDDPLWAVLGDRASGVAAFVEPFDPEVERLVHDLSAVLCGGAGRRLFPDVAGIHAADLARHEIQVSLSPHAALLVAARRRIAHGDIRQVQVMAVDAERAAALAASLRLAGVDARAAGLPRLARLRRLARRLRGSRDDRASVPGRGAWVDHGSPSAEGGILFVSESRPMREMFEAVMAALPPSDRERSTQALFGTGEPGAVRRSEGWTDLHLGRALVAPLAAPPQWPRRWPDTLLRDVPPLIAETSAGAVPVPWRHAVAAARERDFDLQLDTLARAEGVIGARRPSLVVVGNDRWWAGQAFVQVARRQGIPTLVVQDGLHYDSARWWWATADHVAAYCDDWRDILIREGMDPSRVTLTGQPRFDALQAACRAVSREAARERLGIAPDVHLVLVAGQPHHGDAWIAPVADAVAEIPGVAALLRPHPSGPQDAWRRAAGRGDSLRLGGTLPLVDEIAAADVVVVEYSTVTLEAALVGVPVVAATIGRTPIWYPYAKYGLAIEARTTAELSSHVRRLLELPRDRRPFVQQEALHRHVGPLDGRSAERIAALALELTQGRAARASSDG